MHKKISIKTGELAKLLNCQIIGDAELIINDIAEPESANENDIVVLLNKKFIDKVINSKSNAVLTKKEFQINKKSVIISDDIEISFINLLKFFEEPIATFKTSKEKKSLISETVKIGKNVQIMENVIINAETIIGDNSIIFPNSYIGKKVKIGSNVIIYPNVTIYDGCSIGNNVIIHSGTVIGSDGFGYIQRDGKNIKIPQIGNVIIEDDVEIGANTTIDRATIGSTIIRKGVKIDNLVQIAHNVEIGENTIIAGQTGISGSSKIGRNCILAGQVGIADHAIIEDNVIVGAKTGVTSRVVKSEEKMVFGIPARPIMKAKRIEAALSILPEIIKELKK